MINQALTFLSIWLVKGLFPRYWAIPTSLLYAQAKHETGNFTSRIYQENKNLFGMKLARVRKTTGTGERYGHAIFKNSISAIYDYFLRQSYFKITSSPGNYQVETINSGYAEDQDYLRKWNAHKSDMPFYLLALVPVAVLAVVFVVYIIVKKWLPIRIVRKLQFWKKGKRY